MTYFAKFPPLPYSLDNGVTYKIVSDILRRITVNNETKQNYSLFEEYQIKDGETPETVSFKFYNDTQYHWVIMLMNDIIDPRFDWPLTETQLFEFVSSKYSGNISGIQYYTISSEDSTVVEPTQQILRKKVDGLGNISDDGYDTPYANSYPITNLTHESILNEEKRTIRVLRPKHLSAFITEFEALLNG